MTTCLILAAGEAERHNGGNKPMLVVDGETLVDRIWRQFGQFASPKLVTHKESVRASSDSFGVDRFVPIGRRWVTETLLSTRPIWNENGVTIVTLGDVYYTDNAVSEMFNDDLKYAAFGKGCNVYGLRWNSRHHGAIADWLRQSISEAETHPRTHGAGKLWMMAECNRIPLIDFGDETTDFDSPQEHKRFIAKYGNRNTRTTTEASKAR